RVRAGTGRLVRVAERQRRGARVRRQVAGHRQERQVAAGGAADPGQVGQAEPVDLVVVEPVPATGGLAGGVGAPLDHAEGQGGAGERVDLADDAATAAGADERVDQ